MVKKEVEKFKYVSYVSRKMSETMEQWNMTDKGSMP